jgi:hypothetical protein
MVLAGGQQKWKKWGSNLLKTYMSGVFLLSTKNCCFKNSLCIKRAALWWLDPEQI